MTQRERQIPEGGNGPAAVPPLPAGVRPAPSAWESFVRAAPLSLRDELLARARTTGVLYTHQLPEFTADSTAKVGALLNGRPTELSPSRPPVLEAHDTFLDEDQREAVSRALHTPDICLISGVAGSGKSRVVEEILFRAASRGERVLFLGPGAAAVDRVLIPLARREAVYAVRCLARDEAPEHLHEGIREMTVSARTRRFRTETVPQARAAAAAANRQVDEARKREARLARLEELATALADLEARLGSLEARLAALPGEVAAAVVSPSEWAASSRAELAAARFQREEALARLDGCDAALRAEQEKLRAALSAVETDEAKLRQMVEARFGFRFWRGSWWRARGQGKLEEELGQLRLRHEAISGDAARRADEAAALARERADVEAEYSATVRRVVEVETTSRSEILEAERSQIVAKLTDLKAEWEAAVSLLEPEHRPASTCRTEIENRLAESRTTLALAQDAAAAAERWAASCEEAAPDISRQLAASAEIVAATTTVIADDPHFSDPSTRFDLLVLEEAERITESEFVRVARRAARWVVVGETSGDVLQGNPGGPVRPAALRPGFFERLWGNLHEDPSHLPYNWQLLGDGRLRCQLRPVTPDDRTRLETERLADRPDIELGILNHSRGASELAEVVFPADMRASEAKAYLFAELSELPVSPRGHGLCWSEEPDRVVLRLGSGIPADAEKAVVAPGVTEIFGPPLPVGPDGCATIPTLALAFDRSAGWTREGAEEWVSRHVQLRDNGRTAFLGTPHRMRPHLARFVTRLLGGGVRDIHAPHQDSVGTEEHPAVEFIPVPSLEPDAEPRWRGEPDSRRRGGGTATATRLRVSKGGAGLEAELGEARRPDTVPAELRDELPGKGLVNYAEARAVIRDLEGLAADPTFRAEAERWQRSEHERNGPGPAIAVIALYPAQAALIRTLSARAPGLEASSLSIEVGTPEQFRQRECLTALVSLTRSHPHRPVSYGEGPQAFALALTRARLRLLLFGDPGTLVRRSQCAEPVDHLDSSTASRERALVAHLVACIQGQGERPAVFRLRQGNGS